MLLQTNCCAYSHWFEPAHRGLTRDHVGCVDLRRLRGGGLVVGITGQTGIGLQFTESVVALSGGQLWLALFWWPLRTGGNGSATAACSCWRFLTGPAPGMKRADNCTHDCC